MSESADGVTADEFGRLDVRVGRVVEARPFPEGRHSTHVLLVDFGPALGSASRSPGSPPTTGPTNWPAGPCWPWSTSRPGRSAGTGRKC